MDCAHLFDQMTNLDTFMGSENYTSYKVLSGQILDKKMGSLGFCEHFTGCGGRSDVQERDLFSPKRSVAGYCGPEWATARVLCQNP